MRGIIKQAAISQTSGFMTISLIFAQKQLRLRSSVITNIRREYVWKSILTTGNKLVLWYDYTFVFVSDGKGSSFARIMCY